MRGLLRNLILGLIGFCTAAVGEAEPRALSLDECIQIAQDSNFQIKRARQEIERQKGVLKSAIGEMLPQVVASGTVTQVDKNRIPQVGGQRFGQETVWDAGVTVNQDLYTGGRNYTAVQREKLLLEAAEWDYRTALNSILADVQARYYAVLLARESIDVQEELVRLREASLKSEEAKLQAGSVSRFNVLRAEVALSNSRAPLIRARNDLRIAREELKRALGIEGKNEETPDVKGDFTFSPVLVQLDDSLAKAQQQRPELKRLELVREAAKKGVRIQQAQYYPNVQAYAGYGVQGARFGGANKTEGWEAGLTGQWNLFDSFRTQGAVEAARSASESARISLSEVKEAVDIEVRRAFSSLQEAQELADASRMVVNQAKESVRLAQARFDVGSATQLDVLESQVALTEARTNEVTALHNYNLALLQLRRAMGELPLAVVKKDKQ